MALIKRILDGLSYTGKPTLAGTDALAQINVTDADVDDEVQFKGLIPSAASTVFLDWETTRARNVSDPEASWASSLADWKRILDWAHEVNAEHEVGMFSMFGTGATWKDRVAGPGNSAYDAVRIHQQNIAAISDHADFIAPSLYMMGTTLDAWQRVAVHTAALVGPYTVPVYPFLWQEYHQLSQKSGAIPGHLCHQMVRMVTRLAPFDGLVMWGGYQLAWDGADRLWQAAHQYMQTGFL